MFNGPLVMKSCAKTLPARSRDGANPAFLVNLHPDPVNIISQIQRAASASLSALPGVPVKDRDIPVSPTKAEFRGDYTIVVFSLSKQARIPPQELAGRLGADLVRDHPGLIGAFNVVKGFLNLEIQDQLLVDWISGHFSDPPLPEAGGKKVMVEFSSPNTNKPLHLGHLRNNFLGDAVSRILAATGNQVIRANLVNDRGIHICKSMVAWKLFANGATPQSEGMKGDHFVGRYYVSFNDHYQREVEGLMAEGWDRERAEREAPLMKATQHLLQLWEAGDPDTRDLWAQMNGWVYSGFEETYRQLGIRFDHTYYESETYLLGKEIVEDGLQRGIFFRKPEGGVWVDLTGDGLDEKLLIRKDGTSVYITQDLGTAELKYGDYHMDQSIYVIADEQNYHMKVLALVLSRLGKPYASGIFHLSYGMVDLTTGKMKSREGTVVDADDLIRDMIETAASHAGGEGKVKDFTETERLELHQMIGIGAMKFFLLRVNPKKRMVFDPEESIDLNGFTAPFIQYAHARIRSILRKEPDPGMIHKGVPDGQPLLPLERELILQLEKYPSILEEGARELDPSVLAVYLYGLAKSFNSLYAELPIARADTPWKKTLRLRIAMATSLVLSRGMDLLGIRVPERM